MQCSLAGHTEQEGFQGLTAQHLVVSESSQVSCCALHHSMGKPRSQAVSRFIFLTAHVTFELPGEVGEGLV